MTRATAAVASQRFRQRKLSTKHALQVIHENELDPVEPDQQNTQKVETGVEKHEETVSHASFYAVLLRDLIALRSSA